MPNVPEARAVAGTSAPERPPWWVVREDVPTGLEDPRVHATTLVESEDSLLCAFFGGPRRGEDGQGIWLSRRGPRGWEPARPVIVGGEPCWNPVLVRVAESGLVLFFKQGPDCSAWHGRLVRSRDGGSTWFAPEDLPHEIWGPIRNKPIALPGGVLLCGSSTEHGSWRVHFERTPDAGLTWERTPDVADPDALQAIQPTILQWPSGRLQALCRSRASCVAETWSDDGGRTWSPLRPLGIRNPNSAIDGLVLPDGRAILVHNPTTRPPYAWSGPRTPLSVAVSAEGEVWTDLGSIDDDGDEASYPAALLASDGRVRVTWTFGCGWRGFRHAVLDLENLR